MLLKWVERQNLPCLHDTIGLTGGEPLLHTPFLVELLPQVRSVTSLPVYLETGGHRPEQLDTILPYIDSVGMDFKLPSTSGENRWREHAEFLRMCWTSQVEVFIKIIVAQTTNPTELERSAQLVASVNPSIPVFLQPVTPLEDPGAFKQPPMLAPSASQVLNWQAMMKRFVKSVRVVPQTHKILNQL